MLIASYLRNTKESEIKGAADDRDARDVVLTPSVPANNLFSFFILSSALYIYIFSQRLFEHILFPPLGGFHGQGCEREI